MASVRFLAVGAVMLLGGSILSACSDDAPIAANSTTGNGERIIKVTMTEMAFSPSTVALKAGETVKFEFFNAGVVSHEAVFGDEADQQAHAREMAAMASGGSMGSGGHGDGEAAPIVVAPGATGDATYTAESAGELLIGCHQPGHWEAGMKASLEVSA